jgi:hypothetical protein
MRNFVPNPVFSNAGARPLSRAHHHRRYRFGAAARWRISASILAAVRPAMLETTDGFVHRANVRASND